MVVRVILLVLLSGIIAACAVQPQRLSDNAEGPQPTLVPTAVAVAKTTYTVERGEVVYDIDMNGRVAPAIEETLSFPIDGVIAAVHTERNRTVEAGAAVAELDTGEMEEALAQAQTVLDIAQARLESTQGQMARDRRRAEIALQIAQLNLDRAVAAAGPEPTETDQFDIAALELQLELKQLDVDELSSEVDPALTADVEAAALDVEELQADIAHAVLFAPFDGRITTLSAVPGLAVNAFQPLGVIADESQLEVRASLRDNEMEALSEGMPVLVTLANAPGEAYPATISRLPYPYGAGGSTAVEDTDTTTHFSFDDPADAERFSTGDRVNINAVIEARDDVLVLPAVAVRDFGGRKFVVVQEDGIQRRADVTLGISGNGLVEIVDGLSEGQIIVGQ